MRILIAEDDDLSRWKLEFVLKKWGYEVISTANGAEALEALRRDDAPTLGIIDVMMPEMDGIELCREAQRLDRAVPPYLIMLTVRSAKDDVVRGLEAGANDYLSKPFDADELHARVNVGLQMLSLQQKLAERVGELENAFAHVNRLQGLLPICSYCKSIRNDSNYWQSVEDYVCEHTEAQFSHGICPGCYETLVQPELDRLGITGVMSQEYSAAQTAQKK